MLEPKIYRVKPEKVEAWRWSVGFTAGFNTEMEDLWELGKEIAEWCGGKISRDEAPGQELKYYYWVIIVNTPEGGRRLSPGFYVYKDENGDFWVKQPEEFNHRFEEDT